MKVLMVGLYPIVNPIHGGQLRTRAIYERYLQDGCDVIYRGYFGNGWYDDDDIDEMDTVIGVYCDMPVYEYVPDVLVSKMLLENPAVMTDIFSQVHDYRPDIIQFEQPFLYIAFKEAIAQYAKHNQVKVVYSSQNIEADLKRDILTNVSDPRVLKREKDKVVREVWGIEKEMALAADVVVACTQPDAIRLESAGVRNIIIAKNGINPKPDTVGSDELEYWRQWKKLKRIDTLFIFIGSAHPPNATGFLNMIGDRVGFLPHNIGIAVVGGVGDLLQAHLDFGPEHIRETFNLRVHLLGKLTNRHLAAILSESNCVLLPINGGGGSNLKTAEAIYNNKPIIGTSTAFRSYEEYVGSPLVTIADTRKEFQAAILKVANSQNEFKDESMPREKVTWKYILRDLPREIVEV